MKNYKKILYGLIIVIFLISLFCFLRHKKEISLIVPQEENYGLEKVKPKPEIRLKLTNEDKIESKIEAVSDQIKFTITVNDDNYESTIKTGATAFQSMESLETINQNFSFKYTKHASLGNFITEINGKKGSPGKYWIYYVNDKKPSVGVSKYILKDGDIIKWSQEGI